MAIKARNIKAKTVAGVQVRGIDAESAAKLAGVDGDVIADVIEAETVAGFQLLSRPGDATLDELRADVAALRKLPAGTASEEARAELEAVQEELEREKPAGDVVVPKLERAAEILTKSTKTAEAAGKLGTSLAPYVQTLAQAAASLFGV